MAKNPQFLPARMLRVKNLASRSCTWPLVVLCSSAANLGRRRASGSTVPRRGALVPCSHPRRRSQTAPSPLLTPPVAPAAARSRRSPVDSARSPPRRVCPHHCHQTGRAGPVQLLGFDPPGVVVLRPPNATTAGGVVTARTGDAPGWCFAPPYPPPPPPTLTQPGGAVTVPCGGVVTLTVLTVPCG